MYPAKLCLHAFKNTDFTVNTVPSEEYNESEVQSILLIILPVN